MAIRVTARAAVEMAKRSPQLLFSCKAGGCNGFEYVLEPCTTPEKAEKQVISTTTRPITLFTCNLSMLHLLGTEIDWKEDTMGSRFVFNNPNAESKCGCGATFST
jgi:iron-sulfur cluster assembly accessory protein|tara:strand:- start:667 stop:981 length:315 start_codon:yes stop_codon:yes gene_type:complete